MYLFFLQTASVLGKDVLTLGGVCLYHDPHRDTWDTNTSYGQVFERHSEDSTQGNLEDELVDKESDHSAKEEQLQWQDGEDAKGRVY